MNKKRPIIILIIMLIGSNVYTQGGNGEKKGLEEMRMAFDIKGPMEEIMKKMQEQTSFFYANSDFCDFNLQPRTKINFQQQQNVSSKRTITTIDANGNKITKIYINGIEVQGGDDLDFDEQFINKKNLPLEKTDEKIKNFNKIGGLVPETPQDVEILSDKPIKKTTTPLATGKSDGSLDELLQIGKKCVSLLSEYRKNHNRKLSSVEFDEAIYQQCLIHSSFQSNKGCLTHNGFENRVTEQALGYSTIGSHENVAMFSDSSVQPADVAAKFINQWDGSPGHKKNMLAENVNRVSCAVAKRGSSYYATMILVNKA